ncbi:YciI family protein [Pseudalkalibacillus decolorationis]|uniref:YciI family protein n=1 Tax=Pseudalkalibacillus decolorationis TaxID=163879 RepID=UPI002148021F|nr:YciI family protein [Pseudalkalibacillus decolorationis]
MAYFAAILHMNKKELNQTYRQDHLDYIEKLNQEEKIFAKGPFLDGTGGMVIYKADSFEEAKQLAEADPYVQKQVRKLELHEWGL